MRPSVLKWALLWSSDSLPPAFPRAEQMLWTK